LNVVAKERNIKGVRAEGGMVFAGNSQALAFLKELQNDARYGIGREIPKDEIRRLAPHLASNAAVFESAAGVWFTASDSGEVFPKAPEQLGEHGHWPMRYRAAYLAYGPGIRAERLPQISMKDIAKRLAGLLGVTFR